MGLLPLAAASDGAAHSQGGVLSQGRFVRRRAGRRPRTEEAGGIRRLRRGDAALPGGHLGGGSRPRRLEAQVHPRRGRPGGHCRFRVREVLERGGVPLPEAHPRGLRHQQRRPLHTAVPRFERRGPLRGDRLRRRIDDLRRHRQCGRGAHRGVEHHLEPPRRLLLLQAGSPARHQAPRRRSTPGEDGRSRRPVLPDQARHRRRVLQRRPPRDHPTRADRRRLRRKTDVQLRSAGEDRRGLPTRAGGTDLRRDGRADPRSSLASGETPGPRSCSGGWGSPSTRREPTTPAV